MEIPCSLHKQRMLPSSGMRDLNVDQIKKLWVLDLIIRSGSLKGAAATAKVSPSAISQALSGLEKNVGKSLIIRDKGSVKATQEALEILDVVRPAFAVFEKLNDLKSQPLPQMSWLNFGTYESIAVDLLPGLIHSLKEKMPSLKLGLRISRTDQLLTMVRKGELCSAIITEVDDLDRFFKVEVAQDRLGIFISRKHPLASTGLNALQSVGLGALSGGKNGLPRYYQRFSRRLGMLKPTVLSESFETLRAATAAGAIASILPVRVAKRFDDLVEITTEGSDKDSGAHKIFVVSQMNCDIDEANFLAQESRRLLARN